MTDNEIRNSTVETVARELGITPRTLRYYEEVGLISPTSRTSGGHRLYDEKTINRLKEILRLKENLGISLQQIQEIMAAEASLDELRHTFQQNKKSRETQKQVVERYIEVLQQLIRTMDVKIESISKMRELYEGSLQRSLKFLAEEGGNEK